MPKKDTHFFVLRYMTRQMAGGRQMDVVDVPKKEQVQMWIVPMDGQPELPLGAAMVCDGESVTVGISKFDGKDIEPRDEIVFRCGGRRYLFSRLHIEP